MAKKSILFLAAVLGSFGLCASVHGENLSYSDEWVSFEYYAGVNCLIDMHVLDNRALYSCSTKMTNDDLPGVNTMSCPTNRVI